MEKFLKVLRVLFYIFGVVSIAFLIAYHYSDPQKEEYYQYFLYSGFCAIGCSVLRMVLRMI